VKAWRHIAICSLLLAGCIGPDLYPYEYAREMCERRMVCGQIGEPQLNACVDNIAVFDPATDDINCSYQAVSAKECLAVIEDTPCDELDDLAQTQEDCANVWRCDDRSLIR